MTPKPHRPYRLEARARWKESLPWSDWYRVGCFRTEEEREQELKGLRRRALKRAKFFEYRTATTPTNDHPQRTRGTGGPPSAAQID